MRSISRFTLAMLFAVLGSALQAQTVYKTVDEQGNVRFADVPLGDDARRVELPATNSAAGVRTITELEPAQSVGKEVIDYQIEITDPEHDSQIPLGQTEIIVSVTLEPGLAEGHRIQLFRDGEVYGEPTTNRLITMSGLLPGSQELIAAVEAADGTDLSYSQPITIHVQRPRVRKQPRAY